MTRLTRREAFRKAGRGAVALAALNGLRLCGEYDTGPVIAEAAPPAPGRPLKRYGIVLGGPEINEGFVAIAVGQYLGYYRDEGVDVELIPSGGSNQAVQQVALGKVPLGLPSPDPVILGYQPGAGLALEWIYTSYQGCIYDLRTPAGGPLRSPRDLRGKTIGVVNLASAAVPAARAMLHENGVDPASVSFVAIGVGAQAAAAVRAGRVDAVALWDVIYAQLENEGIRFDPPFLSRVLHKLFSNGLVVQPALLTAERAPLTGVCRAMAKGTVWTVANPSQAVRIFWRVYPQAKPVGIADDVALQRSLRALQARLANMTLDWVPVKRWGWNAPNRWVAYEAFLYAQGILKTHVDVTRIYTNDLLAEANAFDAAAIAAHAKSYVLR